MADTENTNITAECIFNMTAAGIVTVESGKYTGKYLVSMNNYDYSKENLTILNIKGGEFDITNDKFLVEIQASHTKGREKCKVVISGGTFNDENYIDYFDKYIPEGKTCGYSEKLTFVKDGYTVPVGGANKKYFYPVNEKVFFPAQKVQFDDIYIYVPNNPESHCANEYGDWKWIPPAEDRWQHFIKEIRF